MSDSICGVNWDGVRKLPRKCLVILDGYEITGDDRYAYPAKVEAYNMRNMTRRVMQLLQKSAKKLPDSGGPLTKELTIVNKLGIHARPAALFVKTANRFACEIFVEKGGEKVNGKSIMGLMMLAAGPGSKLVVHAHGPDASQAITELEALVKKKFDEE